MDPPYCPYYGFILNLLLFMLTCLRRIRLLGIPRSPPCHGGSGAVSAGSGCEKQPRAHPPRPGCLQGPCGVRGRPHQPGSLHPGQRLHLEANPDPRSR